MLYTDKFENFVNRLREIHWEQQINTCGFRKFYSEIYINKNKICSNWRKFPFINIYEKSQKNSLKKLMRKDTSCPS